MIRGLYIAASAAISESKRVDVIANNIANVNTNGYKKDTMLTESFPEILLLKVNEFPDKDVMRANRSTEASTGEKYKAIARAGFFSVQNSLGISKAKSIEFKINEDGYMVTPQGDYILGQKGPINTGGAEVTVDEKGQVISGGTVIDTLKVSNPINVIGTISAGIHVDEIRTDFSQGQLQPTENPLDLAIEGKGFFAVETDEGERYTRNGSFSKDAEGYLVTKEGYKVLGDNGPIIVQGSNIVINENGEVLADGKTAGRLKLADFKDYRGLRKEENGLIRAELEGRPDNEAEFTGKVKQGFLEGSNVDSVKEMVDMLTMLRAYEASQRIIKTHDEILGKTVNEIGRV